MPVSRFPPYPPAQKPMSRKRFMTLVSNVSARKKWLLKYAPDWVGGEIWSEKRVKKYIEDVKNGREILPCAKKVKIPRTWDWERVPVLVVVSEERISRTRPLRRLHTRIQTNDLLILSNFDAFISRMERFDTFME